MTSIQKIVMLAIAFFPLISGCTFFKELIGVGLEPPAVSVGAVDLESISLKKIEMSVILDLVNRNEVELYLYELAYAVEMLGVEVATGRYVGQFALPASGSGQLKLTLVVERDAAAKLINSLLNPNVTLAATIVGDARVGTDLNTFYVPIRETREIKR